jgi:hypothetical protein
VATGTLRVADIRNGDLAACTLLPGGNSPASVSEPLTLAVVEHAERSDEAAELLDDLLIALLDLPGWSDTAPALWTDVALALPNELFERIDQYLEARLS